MPSFESHPELAGLPRVTPPLQNAYAAAGKENPDQAAQIVDLTRRTGQPAPFVAAHLPQIQQALKEPPPEYWARLEKDYPGTTKWLQRPQNMAVAHDDIDNLSRQEQLVQGYSFGQELWKAAKKGGARMAAGAVRLAPTAYEFMLTPGNLLASAIGRPDLETHIPKEWINTREATYWDKVVEANTTTANSADIVGMAGRGDISGAARSLALQVVSTAPNQALLIPATIAGAGVPALVGIGAISAAEAMKDSVDGPAGRTAGTVNAALQGTFEGVSERFGTFGILKHWEKALAKELGKKTAGEVIRATAKVMAYSGLGEGTEEAVNTALGASAAAATGVNPNAYAGLGRQMANAFVVGGASGTGMTAPGALISGRLHLADVKRVEHAQNFYRALGDNAAASKLRQRLPTAYREQLETLTKDGPVESVNIPVADAEAYFQSKKIDPAQFVAGLGLDPKVYAEAQATGTLEIPTAVWAEKVAGTEHYAALADDIKFSVDGYTAREIQREEAAQEKLMQGALAESEKNDATKQQVEEVRKKFYDIYKANFAPVAERDYGAAKGAELLEAAALNQARFEAYLFASAVRKNPGLTVEQFLKRKRRGMAAAQQEGAEVFGEAEAGDTSFNFDEEGNQYPEVQLSPEELKAVEMQSYLEDTAAAGGLTPILDKLRRSRGLDRGKMKKHGWDGMDDMQHLGIYKPGGMSLSEAAERLHADGFLKEYDEQELVEKIQKEILTIGDFKYQHGANTYKRLRRQKLHQKARAALQPLAGYKLFQGPGVLFQSWNRVPRREDYASDKDYLDAVNKALADQVAQMKETDPAQAEAMKEIRKNLARATTAAEAEALIEKAVPPQPAAAPARAEYRGAYDPVNRMITVGKDADASTVLHEMTHDWLEELHAFVNSGQADEAVLKDWQIIGKWLKVKKGQKKLTTAQHEQFARAGELYYREGKAPVEGLRAVFAKLRVWLTNVYREVSQLDVQLTDDVRAVFGRMLAAEDEVTRAELDLNMDSGEVSAVLPADLRAKIQAATAEAHDLAVQALLVQQMGELKPEWEAYVKNKREEAVKAFTVQVGELPLYRALKAIGDQFPAMPVKDIARHVVDGTAPADVAYYFSAVAETQHFSSGDELAKRMISDPTLEEEVEGRLGEYMAQFDDLKNTQAIKDWAQRKVADQERLTIMAMEHAGLNGLIFDGHFPNRERYRIEAAIARDKARQMLAGKSIRNATNFRGFFAAEKRAAKQVVEYVYEKDFVRAAHYKRQEMTNHALAAAALRNRAEVDKALNRAEDILVKKVEMFKGADSFNQAAALLVKFGFGQHRAYNPALKTETLRDWAKRMDGAFGGLDENGNPVEGSGIVNIADWIIAEAPGKPWRDLTMTELMDVRDALDNILRVANIQDRAFKLRENGKISDIVMDLIKGAEANVKKNYQVNVIKERDKGASDYMLSLRRPEQVFNELDGFKDGGVYQRIFEDPVHDAADQEGRRLQEMKDRLAARWAVYSLQEKKDMFERPVFYEEAGTSMTKAHVLAMALNVGNGVNKDKLFSSTPAGIPWDTEWNAKAGMFFLQKYMTERDWDFVQGVWDDINTLWPDLAKMHEEITGFAPGKVEPMPFEVQVPGGPKLYIRGGYYPLAADTRFNEAAALRELNASDPLHTELNPGYKAATRQGHSKARTQAQYAVSLDLGVITRHITDVVHDVSFRGLVYDLRRIVLNPDFANLMKRKMGQNGYWWFKNYVANVATRGAVNKVGTSWLARAVHWLNGHTTTAMVVGRISVFVQNFANPYLAVGAVEDFTAGDVLRGMIGRGLSDYWVKSTFAWRKAADMRAVVMEKSQFMRDRRETPDFSLADMRSTWGKNTDTLKELADNIGESPADTLTYVKEYSIGLMAGTDDMTNIPLWLTAYDKKIAAGAAEAEAVRYADRLIGRITGSGRKYDSARIFRGDDLERALSKLYSFWNVDFNNWLRNHGKAWQGDAKSKAFFLGFLTSRAMFAYTSAILVGQLAPFPGMDDDEDEATWWKKLVKTLLYPVNFFPGIREVVNIAVDNALGLPTYGYRPAPFVSAAEKGVNLGKAIAGAAKGEKEAAQVAEAAMSVAAITGLPMKAPLGNFVMTQAYPDQFNAWIWNAWDYWHNDMEPRPGDLMRRRPKRDR